MTKLREPPLLSDEEITSLLVNMKNCPLDTIDEQALTMVKTANVIAQAQRGADIKWMKKFCYLKAERELPEVNKTYKDFGCNDSIWQDSQQEMLKEVDGVSFRACEEFKDD